MFICNHCPYVKAVIDRIVRDTAELRPWASTAWRSCRTTDRLSGRLVRQHAASRARHGFPFPYLLDETQAVARAYGAVCTPDFFGYNAAGELQYRGRLDASRKDAAPAGAQT